MNSSKNQYQFISKFYCIVVAFFLYDLASQNSNYFFIWLFAFIILGKILISLIKKLILFTEKTGKYLTSLSTDKKAFFIFFLFFLVGISLVLFTDLFTQDGARATFFLQSVTASLAPLAFYITFRNYQRKSGDQFKAIIDMSSTSPFCLTVPSPKQITIQNLKDKPLIIKEISLIINDMYDMILTNKVTSIKAYDTETIDIKSVTFYSSGFSKPIINPKILTSINNKKILITTFNNEFFISEPQRLASVPVSFKKNFSLPSYMDINIQRLTFILNNTHSIIWSIYVDHAIIITNKLYTTTKFIWAIQTNNKNEIIAVHFCYDDFTQEEIQFTVSLVNGTPRYKYGQPNSPLAHEKLLGKTIKNKQDLRKITDNFNEYCDDKILTTLEGYDIHPCYIDKGSLPDRHKDTITLQ